jgi:hypothetical protein
MKNQLPLYLCLLIYSAFGFPGCELFEDEEHCQYETNESKIWNPANNPAVAVKDEENRYHIYFCFERSFNTNSFFKLENVCPFGFIDLKVNIVEKPDISYPLDYLLEIYKIENIKGKKIKNRLFSKIFARKTDTELYVNHTIVIADGLPKDGPVEYALICEAEFTSFFFDNILQAEEWAKNSFVKVEYKTNFVRW